MEKINLSAVLTAVDRYKLFLLRGTPKNIGYTLSSLREKGVPSVDVGMLLSKYLNELGDHDYLHLEAYDYINNKLEIEKRRITEDGNEVVMIYNLGILFEPSLELNPVQLFKDFSKTSAVLLAWEHNVSDGGVLSWPTQREEFYLDFSELQLKYIEDAL